MWQELRSETLRTARNFDRFDVSAARSFLNEPSNTSPAPASPPAPPRGSNPSRRTPGTYYTDGHLSTKFGTDWLAHSRDDNPYSCGSRCETTMLPYVNPPKYAGSVDLTLNYRTEKDDRLYTSDEGRAERADRFTNSHYYRSYYYFSFNRSSGLWMDREYTITWYDESKSEYDPTNSLPHDQILYGNQPQIVQKSYLDGHHGGSVESPDVQHKTTLGVLELTPMEFSKSGALVVKVPPGMDHETRVRFKIFAGGHRMNGGGGYGAYLMPRAEWDDLFFKGIAFNWHGRNEHVPNTQG